MVTVGQLICAAAQKDLDSRIEELRAQVKALTGRFPLYQA